MVDANTSLNTDRLVLAYSRLIRGEWDDYIGVKPDGFDALPRTGKKLLFGRKQLGRFDFTYPAAKAIREIVGNAQLNLLLWRADQCGSDHDWLTWYINERITSYQIEQYESSR